MPLPRKLGLRAGQRVALTGAPSFIAELVASTTGTKPLPRGTIDVSLLFATRAATLRSEVYRLEKRLAPDGMLWLAWPKKSSGVSTDLSFESAQRAGLDAGLVDTKICAIDETWSGLKFVRRLADRGATTKRRPAKRVAAKPSSRGGTRTHDPRINSPLLCQLSYSGITLKFNRSTAYRSTARMLCAAESNAHTI